jgi:myo-inositol-1(or 4)-monophosphatase
VTKVELKKALELAKDAATAAGDCIRGIDPGNIIRNDGRDLKHQADIVLNTIINEYLNKYSSFPILSEEGIKDVENFHDTPLWIVDPLDGTVNFSRGIDMSCVSIALWKNDHPIFGVIYDFNKSNLYCGIVNEGAWCNERKISVSGITSTQKAILLTGFPVQRDFSSKSIKSFIFYIQNFKKVRLLGSAAISLAYLASGHADAYIEEDIYIWDVAAGLALVLSAGGEINIKKSKAPFLLKVVATNGKINEIFPVEQT